MIHETGVRNLLFSLIVVAVAACSAGETNDGPAGQDASKGGALGVEQEATSGGTGGTIIETGTEEAITHPLFGAGSASSSLDLDDPCIAAQVWEASTNVDLSTGALILKDGIVYEVTGEGEGTSVWADEWTEPPCASDTNGHCAKLLYEEVTTCDE